MTSPMSPSGSTGSEPEETGQGLEAKRQRSLRLLALLSPAVLATCLYAGILGNAFVYDDAWLVRRFETWDPDWLTRLTQRRAVAYGFQWLEHGLFGAWPVGYRMGSVLLHGVASSLAALLAQRLSRSLVVGAVCGLLFAAHPVHVEAVASLTNVSDVLAMIFLSLSLWLWASPGASRLQRAGSFVLLGLALHSKPVAAAGGIVMLPLMQVLLLREGAEPLDRRRLLAWFAALFVAASVLLFTGISTGVLGTLLGAESIQQHTEGALASHGAALATSAAAATEQFRLLFWPARLSIDYPIEPHAGAAEPAVALGIALVATWLAVAAALARRHPLAAFAMFWVIVTFLPCSNVLPLTQFFTAERYLYVPSFGVCLLAALSFEGALRGAPRPALRIAAIALLAAALVLASARTIARTRDWRDTASLAEASLRAGIESRRIHHMLGEERWREKDFSGAVHHFARSAEIQPGVPWLHFDLAAALVMDGDLDEAALQVAIGDSAPAPGRKAAQSRLTLARAYLARDLPGAAAPVLERLVASQPQQRPGRVLLAWLRAASKDDDVRDVDRALQIARDTQGAQRLCLNSAAYAGNGDLGQATAEAQRARTLALREQDAPSAKLAASLLDLYRKGTPLRLSGGQILAMSR